MDLAKQKKLTINTKHTVALKTENFISTELINRCKHYFPNDATVFAWQIHTAGWGQWTGSDIQLADKQELCIDNLQELRIFDRQSELHLIRTDNQFTGRFIADSGMDKELMYVDTFSRLFGKSTGTADGFATLIDNSRQTAFKIPVSIAADKHCGLITRNYIEEIGNMGQLSYTDYRFVALESAE